MADHEKDIPNKHHVAVRIDGGSSPQGALRENEDGGLERLPHTQLVPKSPHGQTLNTRKEAQRG